MACVKDRESGNYIWKPNVLKSSDDGFDWDPPAGGSLTWVVLGTIWVCCYLLKNGCIAVM